MWGVLYKTEKEAGLWPRPEIPALRWLKQEDRQLDASTDFIKKHSGRAGGGAYL